MDQYVAIKTGTPIKFDKSNCNTPITPSDWTPLHTAYFFNRIDVVNQLLLVGADPNIKTRGGYTGLQLHKACHPLTVFSEK